MTPSERKEEEIIRRLNEDDGEMSAEERETLLEELAYLQFYGMSSIWSVPR
jgi:hypothetical protein